MTEQLPECVQGATQITVRYWGTARSAAGVETESFAAATLASLIDQIEQRHRGNRKLSDVLSCCAVMIGDLPVGSREPSEVTLSTGDRVEFVPPIAGGSR